MSSTGLPHLVKHFINYISSKHFSVILIKLDQYLIRKIVGAHSKVILEFLYLETSAIPLDFVLTSRRLKFLHTVLSRSDNELTKKIYIAQKTDPIKGTGCTK